MICEKIKLTLTRIEEPIESDYYTSHKPMNQVINQ